VRISYIAEKGSLKVSYDVKNNNYFQLCFEVSDLQLPNGYFFGLTAHTGDVADNHDIYHFHTRLLSAEHSVSALHSDLHVPVYVQSNQETDETNEQGTEEVELSVAQRYHSSVLMWHALSAKEKKSLRGEHVRDVSFPHSKLVTHFEQVQGVLEFREHDEAQNQRVSGGSPESAGGDHGSQARLLVRPLPSLFASSHPTRCAQGQIENAVHELRDLMFTTISEVRELQVHARPFVFSR
jgi:hypothetical protein